MSGSNWMAAHTACVNAAKALAPIFPDKDVVAGAMSLTEKDLTTKSGDIDTPAALLRALAKKLK